MKRVFAVLLICLFLLCSCISAPLRPTDFKITNEFPAELCLSVTAEELAFRAHCRLSHSQGGEILFVSPEQTPSWLSLLLLSPDETFSMELCEVSGMEVYCLQKDHFCLYFEKETRQPLCFQNEEENVRIDFLYVKEP